MPSRVDCWIKRRSIDIGCIIMAQAVIQKTFFGLCRIGDDFRRVKSAKSKRSSSIKHVASIRLKWLFGRKMTRAEFEKRHKVDTGLPFVSHRHKGGKAGLAINVVHFYIQLR
jgi:hypothetical protein